MDSQLSQNILILEIGIFANIIATNNSTLAVEMAFLFFRCDFPVADKIAEVLGIYPKKASTSNKSTKEALLLLKKIQRRGGTKLDKFNIVIKEPLVLIQRSMPKASSQKLLTRNKWWCGGVRDGEKMSGGSREKRRARLPTLLSFFSPITCHFQRHLDWNLIFLVGTHLFSFSLAHFPPPRGERKNESISSTLVKKRHVM